MAKELRAIPGIAKVVLLPRDTEWEKFRRNEKLLADTADIENPLPDQFLVTLARLEDADNVKMSIQKVPMYDEKEGIRDAVLKRRQVTALLEFVRWSGIVLGLITFFTAAVLILNAVHLTVAARRQEIRIMGLVGASRGTIRWPFLLEGAIQGCLGGVLAGMLLWGLAALLHARADALEGPLMSVEHPYPALYITLALTALGALLGFFAAALAVRRHLRVDLP
jgi:cell division transport system permease protein